MKRDRLASAIHIARSYTAAKPAGQATELEKDLTATLVDLRLQLKNHRYLGKKGDLLAFLTQIKVSEGSQEQPALLLANARSPGERNVTIPLSHFWRVLENPMHAFIPEITTRLYGFVTRFDLTRVLDAVFEYAEDIKNSPPPAWMTFQQWREALQTDGWTLQNDGKAVLATGDYKH